MMPPNPRLQRTRSASPPSPLSRQPLDGCEGAELWDLTTLNLAPPSISRIIFYQLARAVFCALGSATGRS